MAPTQEANGNSRGAEENKEGAGGCVTSMATQCVCHLFGFSVPCSKFVRKKPQPTIAQFENVLFLLHVSSFGSVPLPAAVVCQAAQAAPPVRA